MSPKIFTKEKVKINDKSTTIKEIQNKLIEAQKEIITFQKENLEPQTYIKDLELENAKLKNKKGYFRLSQKHFSWKRPA